MARSLEMESPEYLAVKGHIAAINRRVPDADLPSFSSELLQAGLITDASHGDAIATTGLGPRLKIARLTAEAMAAIKATPGLFNSFVDILETRNEEIASVLRKKCSEYRKRHELGERPTTSCVTSTPAGMCHM